MKIWMPTSNDYAWAADISLCLLDKYWPDHWEIDVTHFEIMPRMAMSGKSCFAIEFGKQAELSWTQAAIKYLEGYAPGFFLLMLDDYAVCRPININAVLNPIICLSMGLPYVCSAALTWQPCGPTEESQDRAVFEFPRWDYSFNLQAGVWRRDDMLRILKAIPPETSIRNVEIAGSRYFNAVMYPEGKRMIGWNIPRPANASGFVDETDKSNWLIEYRNLVRMGQRDARHTEWLAKELAS